MPTSSKTTPAFLQSPQNALIKRYRRAFRSGDLTEDGCCAIEGLHLVEEALQSPGVKIVSVLAAESAKTRLGKLASGYGGTLPCHLTTNKIFDSLCQTETPQGVVALVRLSEQKLVDVLATPNLLAAVLVGVQDPGNLGTILRGLEAFGGNACLLTSGSVSPYNSKAVRASAGSLLRLPVFPKLSLAKAAKFCQQAGAKTIGLSPEKGTPLDEIDLIGPVAFFVGGEGAGLPASVLGELDLSARIPLAGPVESLNAAMAASLAFYETARQRRVGKTQK
jgi:TrmH family RNA methyltransferase